jgi:hypothetical protein
MPTGNRQAQTITENTDLGIGMLIAEAEDGIYQRSPQWSASVKGAKSRPAIYAARWTGCNEAATRCVPPHT